jgi:DnaJ-class molecular chaperone
MSVRSEDENSTSQNFARAHSAHYLCANKAVVAPPGVAPALSLAIQATSRGQASGIAEPAMKVCPHCNGRGWVNDGEDCPDCNGTGQVEDDEQEPAPIREPDSD